MIHVKLRRAHYGEGGGAGDYEAVACEGLPVMVEIVAFCAPDEGAYEEAVDSLHAALDDLGIDGDFDYEAQHEDEVEAMDYAAANNSGSWGPESYAPRRRLGT